MVGTLIAPDLGEIFLTSGTPVRRVSLVDAWKGRAAELVAEECPGLWGSSSGPCPYRALGGGRLEHARRDETKLLDAATGATLARFPGEGRISPDSTRCARLVTRTSTERESSSFDWRSDWTRDGDDLSERTVVHREGVAIHFASDHPRHAEAVVLPIHGAYAVRWCGDDGVVAWSNQVIDVCDLATRRPRRLVEAPWVIGSVEVSPSGRFVVGQPPGRPTTLWSTTGEPLGTELPELGRDGLLRVTDGAIVSSWESAAAGVVLWDTRHGRKLPPFATPPGYVTWGFDAEARRAVLVQEDAVTLFERC